MPELRAGRWSSGEYPDKRLIIGIGAARAGTTWLYHYLGGHPEVFMSPVKELHYWDARFRPDAIGDAFRRRGWANWDERFFVLLRELADKTSPTSSPELYARIKAVADRLTMSLDEGAYRSFWEQRVGPAHKAFGEITPGYALLPIEGFQKLREQHPTVRIILLLRDPVDRLFSLFKMWQRMPGYSAVEEFGRVLTQEDSAAVERSRYDLTLERLDKVFRPEEVLVEFYETLFTGDAIRRICHFLSITWQEPDFEYRVNKAPGAGALPPELKSAARDVLAPAYDYCRARFGIRVPQSWNL